MCVTYVLLLSTLGLAIHTRAQGCPQPVAGEHMTLKDSVSQTYQNGDKVSFACDTGYTNVGSSSITCTAGRWSPLKMSCERKNCGSADHEVENGHIDYSEGTEFGDKLVVICNPGHTLVGKNEIYCGIQGWLNKLPECEVVICLPPASVVNVTFSPMRETYEYQDVVQYSCQKDYTLSGSKLLSCSEDGTFNPAPPTCVKVQCDDPDINFAKWVGGSRPPHQYKSTVTLECISGYTMTGARTQTCELDSQWSPGLPTCRLIPASTRPSTTQKTIVYPGPTDPPPGSNGNAKAIGLGIGLTALIGIVLTFCGCYFYGVPAIFKGKRRSGRSAPDTVATKDEEVALA